MAANGDRSEKPTHRRRERAKEEGQYAYSQELTSALTLAAALTTFFYTLGTGSGFRSLFASLLETAIKGPASAEQLQQMIRQAGFFLLKTIAPVLAAAALASLVGSIVQGLPALGANVTGLKWEHLN